ncbi:MAG: bifunctional 3-deoxy-7-phosphoheptulonate synthase/chorismate mutase type II [Bacteroidales bacterium]|nr:bifunctional 3-deoxy-7-phosphoheptulonate synthase/chorismate mutase type II [Bacteroidales bacterium]
MSLNLKINPLKKWLGDYKYPLVISGPCSAESEDQVLETALQLSKIPNVKIFRAGIWKPRTRPGDFEGVGDIGLLWLKKVKQQTNLLTTVEVANPMHVEKCLKNNVDVLWIGARTVVNPFSIQEISNVLKGVDIPVMIKNPVNPDIKLWIGAIERIYNAGIKNIGAIHRGFFIYDNKVYRNQPMWEIPIELKRLLPDLPIIVDPSHICGNRQLLSAVSQRAMDLGMSGLMIESHPNPSKALSDANQQIEPSKLETLLSELIIRKQKGDIDFENKLEELRSQIDEIDLKLIEDLANRMQVVDEIGKYKQENKITVLQLKRWNTIINDRLKSGEKLGIYNDFLVKILELIHLESIRRQTNIVKNSKNI